MRNKIISFDQTKIKHFVWEPGTTHHHAETILMGDKSKLRGEWMQPNAERSLNKTCSECLQPEVGQQFTFQHHDDLKQTAKTMLEWLWDKYLTDCSRLAQPKLRFKAGMRGLLHEHQHAMIGLQELKGWATITTEMEEATVSKSQWRDLKMQVQTLTIKSEGAWVYLPKRMVWTAQIQVYKELWEL